MTGSKSVKWLLDNTGEPLVYVIDTCSSYEDEKLDKTSTEECDLNAEYEQKELRYVFFFKYSLKGEN